MNQILVKISEQEKLIKKQGEEINKLRTDNLKFKSQVTHLENRLNRQGPPENNFNANQQSYSEKTKSSLSLNTCRMEGNRVTHSGPQDHISKPSQPRQNQVHHNRNKGVHPVADLEKITDETSNPTPRQDSINQDQADEFVAWC